MIGPVTGKLRALFNDKGKRIKSAGPSTPVEVLGLSGVPSAGDRLAVVPDEKTARQQAALYQRAAERNASSVAGDVSLEDIFTRMKEGEVGDLNLVVKADVQGSIEPLVTSLQRLQEEGLRVKVIGSGTGNVTESDVMLASASKAIIVAFNVRAEPGARSAAETQHVDIRHYDVIYNVVEDVRRALVGLLGPRFREVVHGHAEIRQIFPVRKGGAAAGCLVMDGQILRNDLGAREARRSGLLGRQDRHAAPDQGRRPRGRRWYGVRHRARRLLATSARATSSSRSVSRRSPRSRRGIRLAWRRAGHEPVAGARPDSTSRAQSDYRWGSTWSPVDSSASTSCSETRSTSCCATRPTIRCWRR